MKLEEESHSLQDQHKNLELKVKILEEKIAIGHLEDVNSSTRNSIAQLESKVQGLKDTLEQLPEKKNAEHREEESVHVEAVATPEPILEEAVTETETASFDEEPQEETVEVATVEEPSPSTESYADNLKRRDERKKRRFF